jgi:hypothetical protein
MCRAYLAALLVSASCLLGALPVVAADPVSIKVNFSPDGNYTTSDGQNVTMMPSGLTDDQKKAVLKSIQDNYNDAVGPGKVNVEEGAGGKYNIVVGANGFPGRGLYGDAGADGGASLVFAGTFTARGYKDQKLTDGIGEAAAHEVFHKVTGLTDHNANKPLDKMSNMTKEEREAVTGTLKFNDADKALLKQNLVASSTVPDLGPGFNKLPAYVGVPLPLSGGVETTDIVFDMTATFSGPLGSEFGYMSNAGDFIFAGGLGTSEIGIVYSGFWDIALSLNGSFYDLLSGVGTFTLSDPNSLNPSVYRDAVLQFTTVEGAATLVFHGPSSAGTGGFGQVAAVPEPGTLGLLAFGVAALAGRALAQRRSAAHTRSRPTPLSANVWPAPEG